MQEKPKGEGEEGGKEKRKDAEEPPTSLSQDAASQKQKRKSRKQRELQRLASGLDGNKWKKGVEHDSIAQPRGTTTETHVVGEDAASPSTAGGENELSVINAFSLHEMQEYFRPSRQHSITEKKVEGGGEEKKEEEARETQKNNINNNNNARHPIGNGSSEDGLDGEYWRPTFQDGKRPSTSRGRGSGYLQGLASFELGAGDDEYELSSEDEEEDSEDFDDEKLFVEDHCSEDEEEEEEAKEEDEEGGKGEDGLIASSQGRLRARATMYDMFTEEAIKGWSQNKISAWVNKRDNPNGFYYRFLGNSLLFFNCD